ncbi:hypothetical protein [Prosthecodimorpha hirschii]|uniref:hypothetical protein n=1 Tax=Prosthecodimorpha hirschii TaxID=665126 RepID=UPI001128C609|nr:hypothetical protein [Prosthecomicrobium hirschii]
MLINHLPEIETVVIAEICKKYPDYGTISAILDAVKECDVSGSSEGYILDIIYNDCDSRKLDFRTIDKNDIHRFRGVISINKERPYGIYLTFLGGRAIGSEVFAMGNKIPEEIFDIEIEEINKI